MCIVHCVCAVRLIERCTVHTTQTLSRYLSGHLTIWRFTFYHSIKCLLSGWLTEGASNCYRNSMRHFRGMNEVNLVPQRTAWCAIFFFNSSKILWILNEIIHRRRCVPNRCRTWALSVLMNFLRRQYEEWKTGCSPRSSILNIIYEFHTERRPAPMAAIPVRWEFINFWREQEGDRCCAQMKWFGGCTIDAHMYFPANKRWQQMSIVCAIVRRIMDSQAHGMQWPIPFSFANTRRRSILICGCILIRTWKWPHVIIYYHHFLIQMANTLQSCSSVQCTRRAHNFRF